MNPRLRKAIGGVLILIFLPAYVWLSATLAAHLPGNKAVQLLFYVVAGVAWGAPLLPLLSWMDRGR